MKRYIRTKDRKIIDTDKKIISVFSYDSYPNIIAYRIGDDEILERDVLKESNNVFELIAENDLVIIRTKYYIYSAIVEELTLESIKRRCKEEYKTLEDLVDIQIYTKQNDNYVLVWNNKR